MPENQTAWNSNNQGVKKKHSMRPVGGQLSGKDVRDNFGQVGLAKQEDKDSKLAVNYCEDCYSGRNSQSHMREFDRK